MKVLWVVPGDPNSKVNMIFAKRTVPALEAKGINIEIFHLTSRTNPLSLLRLWLEARKVIKNSSAQLVHGQYGSIAGLFAALLGLPSVITFRGSDINGDPDHSAVRNLITKISSQLAAALSSASVYVSKQMQFKLGFPGKQVYCLPSPLNTELFRPLDRAVCRSDLGFAQDEKLISFISSGGRGLKRPELAREVVEKLKQKNPKARLLEIRGIDPSDVPKWLSASDCMLFTSLREGSPNAVREALACGVPVVTVSVGDVHRWVSKDNGSRIVEDDSAENLARAVEQVWNQKRTTDSRVDFREISLDAHTESLKSIYKKVLEN